MTVEQIADYYGLESQSAQLVEEMAELTVALSKFRRAGYEIGTETMNDVTEEIADVETMLKQMKYLMGSTNQVEQIRREKIERQSNRIREEKELLEWMQSNIRDGGIKCVKSTVGNQPVKDTAHSLPTALRRMVREWKKKW